MKNTIYYILSLVLLGSLLTSCSNEAIDENTTVSVVNEKDDILNAPIGKQIDYKRKHLKNLGAWVAANRQAILDEAVLNLRSNEETDVFLMEHLIETTINNGGSNSQREIPLSLSYNAFKDLGTESWLPTLRVLNADQDLLKSSTVQQSFVIIEDSDGLDETASIYLVGENDDLVAYDGPTSDVQNSDSPIFVLELDPCSSSGAYIGVVDQSNPCNTDPWAGDFGSGGGGSNVQRLQLDNATIKDLKEGWPFRTELAMKAYKLPSIQQGVYYDCGDAIAMSDNCQNYTGKRIARVKRSHKNDNRSYDYTMETGNSFTNDILIYVIFEQDSFPAPVKGAGEDLPINGANWGIGYRSWQSQYDSQTLSQNSTYGLPLVYGFSNENSDIKYNLKSAW